MSHNSIDRTQWNNIAPAPAEAGVANGVAARRRRLLGYVRVVEGGRAEAEHFRWFSTSTELEHLLGRMSVRNVYIAGDEREQREARQSAFEVCQRFGIPFAPAARNGARRIPPANPALADGYLDFVPNDTAVKKAGAKRVVDVLLSVAALVVLLPLFALLAVAIKLTDRGPIFFGQARVGLRGRTFTMLKFRSMIANADELKPRLESLNESDGPVFKMSSDPRITRIGRILRKYSLDELPQLINVLRGEMSFVGPRPPVPHEVAQYEPWQFRRLAVRPGLTCLWQVSPTRYRMSFDDWVRLDLQYIDQWTLGLDLRLILRTFRVVLAGTGE